MSRLLSQEGRLKLQNLINYPAITCVQIADHKSEDPYTDVVIWADCSLEEFQKILDLEDIEYGPPRDFSCEHKDAWSIGHSFNGTIERCDIAFIVAKEIKKTAEKEKNDERTAMA